MPDLGCGDRAPGPAPARLRTELADGLAAAGLPAEFAEVLASLDGVIAAGAQSVVTDTVTTIAGRPPRSVHETLAAAVGAGRTTR